MPAHEPVASIISISNTRALFEALGFQQACQPVVEFVEALSAKLGFDLFEGLLPASAFGVT